MELSAAVGYTTVAFASGIVAAGAFANGSLWRGPLVRLIGGGDISIYVGFALAFAVYFVLMREVIRLP